MEYDIRKISRKCHKNKNSSQCSLFVHLARQKGKQGNGYSLLYTKIQKIPRGRLEGKRKHHGKIGFGLVKMNNKVLGVLYEVYLRFILLEI